MYDFLSFDAEHLFDLTAHITEMRLTEPSPTEPRRIFCVTSGAFRGPRFQGTVMPGEADWITARANGLYALDVRLALRTDDRHLVVMTYRGLLEPPHHCRNGNGHQTTDPPNGHFRTAASFTTEAEPYRWLERVVAIGIGQRERDCIHYRVFAIR